MGVEAVWTVLTPNNVINDSEIQRIAVWSFYNQNNIQIILNLVLFSA